MNKYSNIKQILFVVLLLISLSNSSQEVQQNSQSIQSSQSNSINHDGKSQQKLLTQPKIDKEPISINTIKSQLPYTQNILQFKQKKTYNHRLQTVVGCWLLSKQYLEQSKSNYLFFSNSILKQLVTLKLVKQCMKRISRKDAVLKITQLVGKNITSTKKYQQVVLDKQIIDNIFIEVNKQNIANVEQYQAGEEEVGNGTVVNKNQVKAELTLDMINNRNQSDKKGQTPIQTTESNKAYQSNDQSNNNKLSQFDQFLLDLIKKYDSQFHHLKGSKQGIKGKVQEQLKKRQKYYFGFIPASTFSHSVFLVTISLSMVFCCTCYKYYKMRSSQKDSLKMKQGEQGSHVHSSTCSHSRPNLKQVKKLASKMSQMTLKKKTK